ncbi:MAG: AIR carboxylase family protein [Acidobacteriaceae bacterium]
MIILGSKSDAKILKESGMTEVFKSCEVSYEIFIISAHRNHAELFAFVVKNYKENEPAVYIAAAGMAAALPGAIACLDPITPVIGVPLPSAEFPDALDALLSMVRMPPGTPVMVPGIGKSGLKNAAVAACQILAASDGLVAERLYQFRIKTNKPAEIPFVEDEEPVRLSSPRNQE